ncbi:YoaK family protein [Sedimentibacter sp. MB35-C1]|uniref:YoaK family protein n=1 Tax=Sedimentibacter sp. MB35-C1 TaxID=3070995 RepID=UPI0027E0CE3D|nr:YoaK family protein [Sedimentibacter sp. MB35-C1]WMJ78927.1 YoaK family protein [Sedimentibacter sp. MB35-C1]
MNKKQINNEINRWQMSESIMIGILLAFSGGYMDAYTYVFRGKVFANAQTGNIILLGINISGLNYSEAVRYLIPVISFIAGVFTAQMLKLKFGNTRKIHWRQIGILVEIIIMLVVSLMGTDLNLVANSMISYACGIQVQSFRKIHDNSLATTMCIGNLRTATDLLCGSIIKKDTSLFHRSIFYYGVIFIFTIGAISGKNCIAILGQQAILVSVVILSIVFLFMFFEKEVEIDILRAGQKNKRKFK